MADINLLIPKFTGENINFCSFIHLDNKVDKFGNWHTSVHFIADKDHINEDCLPDKAGWNTKDKIKYVEEDEEFVLGGLDKITKKNPKLDIDKYLDKNTYPNRVKIRLNDSISEKLDDKEIEIIHRGKTIKHKVKYNDEPYEFMLD